MLHSHQSPSHGGMEPSSMTLKLTLTQNYIWFRQIRRGDEPDDDELPFTAELIGKLGIQTSDFQIQLTSQGFRKLNPLGHEKRRNYFVGFTTHHLT